MKHEHKTDKSIYNILIGKKTHQTYFDATIEHLKLYYGCLPNLKYSDFEQVIETNHDVQNKAFVSNHFYEQVQQTVKTILLLIQMMSQKKHHHFKYQPIINDTTIQTKAKEIYVLLKDEDDQSFIDEIYTLLDEMEQHFQKIYFHYLLTGYHETSYTSEQIALLEGISILELKSQLIEEYQFIQKCIQQSDKYPILSQIEFKPKLHQQTLGTYQFLDSTHDIEKLAQFKQVKTHTIHDHIIEMYIKGYITDKHMFIEEEKFELFLKAFNEKPNQNLKYYFEAIGSLDYFEIKLIYVIFAMEELNVTN